MVPCTGPRTDQQRIDAINAQPHAYRSNYPAKKDRLQENKYWHSLWDNSNNYIKVSNLRTLVNAIYRPGNANDLANDHGGYSNVGFELRPNPTGNGE